MNEEMLLVKRKGILVLLAAMLLLSACGNNAADIGAPTTVQEQSITVTLVYDGDSVDVEGKYTGEVVSGKPQGEGKFVAERDDDLSYEYEGTFADGCFDGYGVATIVSNGETLRMAGTYTKGEFTPTTGEVYDFIGQLDLFGKFSVPASVIEYIDSNENLFPVATEEMIQSAKIQDFSYKQFTKTRKQEDIGLVSVDLYAVQVFEDDFMDGKITYMLAVDDDNNYYALYYLDTVEVYEDDSFSAYAVPCATTGFDNIGGGTTNVVAMAVSYIE